jgi:aminoglycoside 6'-N-acetyltransferase
MVDLGGVTTGQTLQGEQVILEPIEPDHVVELRRILATSEVRSRWGDEAASPNWPYEEGSETRFAIIFDGEVRGMVQYGEEDSPGYRHAWIDIFVDPVVHRQGVGSDAVRTVVRHLIADRGHHRIVIDPASDNVAAIRCYESVGFRPVGIMREYEHDVDGNGWHDGLLMDLLADEFD